MPTNSKSVHRHKRHLLHSAGILATKTTLEDTTRLSIPTLFWHRFPWILIGLLGAFFSVSVVEFFSVTLSQNLVLAAFIPLIVYVSSAVGNQTQTLFIRDLLIQRSTLSLKYILKHAFVTLLIALVCSIIVFIGALLFTTPLYLSSLITLSTFITISSSVFISLLIPFLLRILHQDPAIGSGPFATIIQDIVTITLYLSIASYFL